MSQSQNVVRNDLALERSLSVTTNGFPIDAVDHRPKRQFPVNPRIDRLDLLRGIAVLLIVGRHYTMSALWKQVGWSGVDIFFVLSGFLVSGLIFREYQREGKVSLRRFWIRRALRIYPPFLVMLTITTLLRIWIGPAFQPSQVAAELFWVQNYYQGMWIHTWSLGVEEHFYILLPLLMGWLILCNRGSSDPFTRLPEITIAVGAAALTLREMEANFIPFQARTHLFATHLRIDSLFFGAMLAYIYWFRRDALIHFLTKWKCCVPLASAALLLPVFVFPIEHWFMRTVGLTMVYTGAGGILLLTLFIEGPLAWPSRLLIYIGKRSYSMYLWHLAVLQWGVQTVYLLPGRLPGLDSLAYIVGSVLIGAAMYNLVEAPATRLRDRLVPGGAREQSWLVDRVVCHSGPPSLHDLVSRP